MRIWDVANFPALVRKREKEKNCPVIEDRKSGPVLNMCEKGSRTRGQEAKLQQRRRRRKERRITVLPTPLVRDMLRHPRRGRLSISFQYIPSGLLRSRFLSQKEEEKIGYKTEAGRSSPRSEG